MVLVVFVLPFTTSKLTAKVGYAFTFKDGSVFLEGEEEKHINFAGSVSANYCASAVVQLVINN